MERSQDPKMDGEVVEEGVGAVPSQESSLHRPTVDDELGFAAEELVTGSQKNWALNEASFQPEDHQAAVCRDDGGRAVLINQPRLSSLKRENFVRTKKPSLDSECSEISLNGEGGGTTVQGSAMIEETS